VVGSAKFVQPAGGTIVADYFDVGQSRSVPWDRRGEASRLLAALKDRTVAGSASWSARGRGAGSGSSSR
jgi:hypothetical protein